ncbi:putative DNA-binding domain-containing protein [Bowmanella yangjiangensis]|uniref:DNA-binding domain-containing protein n=1 Tax=Bowmanella yangjiangensis TaxID=2811230 RepID=A0ABS3CRS2_9ALTE|nr:putative DNA-binding domain-containing protein [Bowmanella yangjiangensis]MBN7819813.1 putative DNA-binding domain-containing protein [Bowmanella yangjiangensis]
MDNLNQMQHQLLTDIFKPQPNSIFDANGLAIYQANLRATAKRALSITFPTVNQLIGSELLGYFADRLLASELPYHGDWALWGKTLPTIMKGHPALANYPFVVDCAELDYQCHQLLRQQDVSFIHSTLSLLHEYSPETLFLRLNPTLYLMTSEYPIVDIRSAHMLSSTKQRQTALRQIVENTQPSMQFHVMAYKNGRNLQVSSISKLHFDWLTLIGEHSIDTALNKISNTEFSFQNWLLTALQENIILEVNHSASK